jgi:pimeloyl-ACP methyl ester carboxylesterase
VSATLDGMTTTPGDGGRLLARLHDGTEIPVLRVGSGPALLLPVRTQPHDPGTAAEMRAWGGDPDHGPTLVRGLADRCTVVAADYEGHRMAHPAPGTLTAPALAADLLAIADAAGVDRFWCYGYSWLAVAALQLAVRTERLDGLVMGGFPPSGGPYAAMLAVTRAAHDRAEAGPPPADPDAPEPTPGDWDSAGMRADPDQTRQFVTLYEDLRTFDDADASCRLEVPRFCFAGDRDDIDYGAGWGDVRVEIAGALRRHRAELEACGWVVELLPGLDHLGAMHGDVVLPLLRRWIAAPSGSPGP